MHILIKLFFFFSLICLFIIIFYLRLKISLINNSIDIFIFEQKLY